MDLIPRKELIENAHNAGIEALSMEERLLMSDLVNMLVVNGYLMLIVLTSNEDDLQIWWNKYAPYYRAFIIYLAKQGEQNLLKEPNINLDVKSEQIYVNYRKVEEIRLSLLPPFEEMMDNSVILNEF